MYILETDAKIHALKHFEKALAAGGKYFDLDLINNETVAVIDRISGNEKRVNIACDNVPAMLYDILKQAGDWIM